MSAHEIDSANTHWLSEHFTQIKTDGSKLYMGHVTIMDSGDNNTKTVPTSAALYVNGGAIVSNVDITLDVFPGADPVEQRRVFLSINDSNALANGTYVIKFSSTSYDADVSSTLFTLATSVTLTATTDPLSLGASSGHYDSTSGNYVVYTDRNSDASALNTADVNVFDKVVSGAKDATIATIKQAVKISAPGHAISDGDSVTVANTTSYNGAQDVIYVSGDDIWIDVDYATNTHSSGTIGGTAITAIAADNLRVTTSSAHGLTTSAAVHIRDTTNYDTSGGTGTTPLYASGSVLLLDDTSLTYVSDETEGSIIGGFWYFSKYTVSGTVGNDDEPAVSYTLVAVESDGDSLTDVIRCVDISTAQDGTEWVLVIPSSTTSSASRSYESIVSINATDNSGRNIAENITLNYLDPPTFSYVMDNSTDSDNIDTGYTVTAGTYAGLQAVYSADGTNNALTKVLKVTVDGTSASSASSTPFSIHGDSTSFASVSSTGHAAQAAYIELVASLTVDASSANNIYDYGVDNGVQFTEFQRTFSPNSISDMDTALGFEAKVILFKKPELVSTYSDNTATYPIYVGDTTTDLDIANDLKIDEGSGFENTEVVDAITVGSVSIGAAATRGATAQSGATLDNDDGHVRLNQASHGLSEGDVVVLQDWSVSAYNDSAYLVLTVDGDNFTLDCEYTSAANSGTWFSEISITQGSAPSSGEFGSDAYSRIRASGTGSNSDGVRLVRDHAGNSTYTFRVQGNLTVGTGTASNTYVEVDSAVSAWYLKKPTLSVSYNSKYINAESINDDTDTHLILIDDIDDSTNGKLFTFTCDEMLQTAADEDISGTTAGSVDNAVFVIDAKSDSTKDYFRFISSSSSQGVVGFRSSSNGGDATAVQTNYVLSSDADNASYSTWAALNPTSNPVIMYAENDRVFNVFSSTRTCALFNSANSEMSATITTTPTNPIYVGEDATLVSGVDIGSTIGFGTEATDIYATADGSANYSASFTDASSGLTESSGTWTIDDGGAYDTETRQLYTAAPYRQFRRHTDVRLRAGGHDAHTMEYVNVRVWYQPAPSVVVSSTSLSTYKVKTGASNGAGYSAVRLTDIGTDTVASAQVSDPISVRIVVTGVSDNGGNALFTTDTDHGLSVNDVIIVSGTSGYDVRGTVSVVGSTTTFEITGVSYGSSESGLSATVALASEGEFVVHGSGDFVLLNDKTDLTSSAIDATLLLSSSLKKNTFDIVSYASGTNTTVTVDSAHGLSNGDSVTIVDSETGAYNGIKTVSSVTSTTFDIDTAFDDDPTVKGKVLTSAHELTTGSDSLSGSTPAEADATNPSADNHLFFKEFGRYFAVDSGLTGTDRTMVVFDDVDATPIIPVADDESPVYVTTGTDYFMEDLYPTGGYGEVAYSQITKGALNTTESWTTRVTLNGDKLEFASGAAARTTYSTVAGTADNRIDVRVITDVQLRSDSTVDTNTAYSTIGVDEAHGSGGIVTWYLIPPTFTFAGPMSFSDITQETGGDRSVNTDDFSSEAILTISTNSSLDTSASFSLGTAGSIFDVSSANTASECTVYFDSGTSGSEAGENYKLTFTNDEDTDGTNGDETAITSRVFYYTEFGVNHWMRHKASDATYSEINNGESSTGLYDFTEDSLTFSGYSRKLTSSAYRITNIETYDSGNKTLITTSANHGWSVGDEIVIDGTDNYDDGQNITTYTIHADTSGVSNNQFVIDEAYDPETNPFASDDGRVVILKSESDTYNMKVTVLGTVNISKDDGPYYVYLSATENEASSHKILSVNLDTIVYNRGLQVLIGTTDVTDDFIVKKGATTIQSGTEVIESTDFVGVVDIFAKTLASQNVSTVRTSKSSSGYFTGLTTIPSSGKIRITSSSHGLSDDDIVLISGTGSDLDGNTYTVSGTATNTFQITAASSFSGIREGQWTNWNNSGAEAPTSYTFNFLRTSTTEAIGIQESIFIFDRPNLTFTLADGVDTDRFSGTHVDELITNVDEYDGQHPAFRDIRISVTSITGDGSTTTYTTSDSHGLSSGEYITVKGKSSFSNGATDVVISSVTSNTVTIAQAYSSQSYTSGEATIFHDLLVGRVQVDQTINGYNDSNTNIGWGLSAGSNSTYYKLTKDAAGKNSMTMADDNDHLLTCYLQLKSSSVAKASAYGLPTLNFTEMTKRGTDTVTQSFAVSYDRPEPQSGTFSQIYRYFPMEINSVRENDAETGSSPWAVVKDGDVYSTDKDTFLTTGTGTNGNTGAHVELSTRFGLGTYTSTPVLENTPTGVTYAHVDGSIVVGDDHYNYDDGLTHVWGENGGSAARLKASAITTDAIPTPSSGSSEYVDLGTFSASLVSQLDPSVDGSGGTLITHAANGITATTVPESDEKLLVWSDLEVVGTASTERYVHVDITLDDGQVALPHANYVRGGVIKTSSAESVDTTAYAWSSSGDIANKLTTGSGDNRGKVVTASLSGTDIETLSSGTLTATDQLGKTVNVLTDLGIKKYDPNLNLSALRGDGTSTLTTDVAVNGNAFVHYTSSEGSEVGEFRFNLEGGHPDSNNSGASYRLSLTSEIHDNSGSDVTSSFLNSGISIADSNVQTEDDILLPDEYTTITTGKAPASISEVFRLMVIKTTVDHGFSVGETAVLSGTQSNYQADDFYNGTYTIIAVPTSNTIVIDRKLEGSDATITQGDVDVSGHGTKWITHNGGSTYDSKVGVTTSADHGFTTSDSVVVSSTTNYNGTYTPDLASGSTLVISATWVSVENSGSATVGEAHDFSNGDSVTISNTTNYNGDYVVSSASTYSFKVKVDFVSNEATGTVGDDNIAILSMTDGGLVDMSSYHNKVYRYHTYTDDIDSAANDHVVQDGTTPLDGVQTLIGSASAYTYILVAEDADAVAAYMPQHDLIGSKYLTNTVEGDETILVDSIAGSNGNAETRIIFQTAHGYSAGQTIYLSGFSETRLNSENGFTILSVNDVARSVDIDRAWEGDEDEAIMGYAVPTRTYVDITNSRSTGISFTVTSDNNGNTQFTLADASTLIVNMSVKVSGTTSYDGWHTILSIDGNDVVLDVDWANNGNESGTLEAAYLTDTSLSKILENASLAGDSDRPDNFIIALATSGTARFSDRSPYTGAKITIGGSPQPTLEDNEKNWFSVGKYVQGTADNTWDQSTNGNTLSVTLDNTYNTSASIGDTFYINMYIGNGDSEPLVSLPVYVRTSYASMKIMGLDKEKSFDGDVDHAAGARLKGSSNPDGITYKFTFGDIDMHTGNAHGLTNIDARLQVERADGYWYDMTKWLCGDGYVRHSRVETYDSTKLSFGQISGDEGYLRVSCSTASDSDTFLQLNYLPEQYVGDTIAAHVAGSQFADVIKFRLGMRSSDAGSTNLWHFSEFFFDRSSVTGAPSGHYSETVRHGSTATRVLTDNARETGGASLATGEYTTYAEIVKADDDTVIGVRYVPHPGRSTDKYVRLSSLVEQALADGVSGIPDQEDNKDEFVTFFEGRTEMPHLVDGQWFVDDIYTDAGVAESIQWSGTTVTTKTEHSGHWVLRVAHTNSSYSA